MITATRAHTITIERFANPYLRCDACGQPVTGYVVGTSDNYPCRHLGVTSACPSWSPVDDCLCLEYLGHREHPLATATG